VGTSPRSIVAIIPARRGSVRAPGKNIALVGGRPLLAWSIEAARRCTSVGRTIVSTDCPQTAAIALSWGASVPFLRPPELATDSCTNTDVVLHALDWLAKAGAHFEHVLLLQPTSPLRTASDIDAAFSLLVQHQASAVVSVCPDAVGTAPAVQVGADLTLQPGAAPPSASPGYVHNGAIYLTRCDAFLSQRTFEPPGTLAYVMPAARSLDIDEPWQLRLAQDLLAPRKAAG
jgi:CMP-N-acetylneuraminic acid synthetase